MPAQPTGSSVARWRLGDELRKLRTENDVTLEQAAKHIERSRQTLWKIETGKPGATIKNLELNALCDLYQAPTEVRQFLFALAEITRVKGWYQKFADLLPPNFDMYIGLEEGASELCNYESELVPGLIQTEDYAREVVRVPWMTGVPGTREIERRVKMRLRRQDILIRDDPEPVKLDVVLNEAVLRRPVGGPTVMTEQLHHINELGSLPNVSVRVIPFDAGLHEGIIAGPFVIVRLPGDNPTVVYVDAFTGMLFYDQDKEVVRYEASFLEIRKLSLAQQASRELITQVAEEFSRA